MSPSSSSPESTELHWNTGSFRYFTAGVLATVIVAALVANFGGVKVWVSSWMSRSRTKRRVEVAVVDTEKEAPDDGQRNEDEGGTLEVAATPRKPFEFREGLWEEPPELDYEWFECHDAVQKEFKNIGGKELEWKTNWLDLQTETLLLFEYQEWDQYCLQGSELLSREEVFYGRLVKSLRKDFDAVRREQQANNTRHNECDGKDRGLFNLVKLVRERERHRAEQRA